MGYLYRLIIKLYNNGEYCINSEKLGFQYGPTAAGRRSVFNPNFEEFIQYSPIRPSQTYGIHIVINLIRAQHRIFNQKVKIT